MNRIFKYPLHIEDAQLVNMPAGAKMLSVGADSNDTPCLWALIDDHVDTPRVSRLVIIRGTGHSCDQINPDWFVGTVIVKPLVWHIFVKPEEITK